MHNPPFFCFSVILFSVLCMHYSYGQTEVKLGIAIKNHPDNLLTIRSGMYDFDEDFSPIIQITPGIRKKIANGPWIMEATLSYSHTRISNEGVMMSATDMGFYLTKITFQELLNFVGLKAGMAYNFNLGHGTDRFSLPFGLQAMVPFGCKRIMDAGSYTSESELYRKDSFKNGFFYGAYFRPVYHFNFSHSRNYPWSFGIYAEGDLLILNQSEDNPKFIYGGGLEVAYRIK